MALRCQSRDGTMRDRGLSLWSEAQLSLPFFSLSSFFSDWFQIQFALWQGVVEWVEAATRTGPYGPCSLCLSCEAQDPESPAAGESSRLEFSCPLSMLSSQAPHPQRVRSDSQAEGQPSCYCFSAGPSLEERQKQPERLDSGLFNRQRLLDVISGL